LTLTWQNSILRSNSHLDSNLNLQDSREWIELRKKCSTWFNDYTKYNTIRVQDNILRNNLTIIEDNLQFALFFAKYQI